MLKLLKRLLRSKRPKLAQTQEAFDAQCDKFLTDNGIVPTEELRALYGTFIQHSSETDDRLDEKVMLRRLRKAQAMRLAFYLIHPSKRPKEEGNEPQEPGV